MAMMMATTAQQCQGGDTRSSGLLLNCIGGSLSTTSSANPPRPERRQHQRLSDRTSSPHHLPGSTEGDHKPTTQHYSQQREANSSTDAPNDSIPHSNTSNLSGDYGPPPPNFSHASQELVMPVIKFPRSRSSRPLRTSATTATTATPRPHPLRATVQQSGRARQSSQISSSQAAKSFENEPGYPTIKLAADCLHAQDYSRMLAVLASELVSIAVLFGRGLAYYKLRKHQEAIECLERMCELVRSSDLNEHGNLYLAQYYLGEITVAINEYRRAAKHYQKASRAYATETVARQYRIVQPSLASIFSKQGSSLRHAQQIMEAVGAYRDALAVVESPKDRLAVHTSLGNLYQSLGENASALEQYEHTISLAEELKDFVSLGWAHGNMGNAYLGLYQKDKALRHLEKSLELTIEHEPTPQAIGRAYNNLGTAHQSLNDLKKAEEYYNLALSQAIYGSDLGGQARVYGNYGNLLMIQKRYVESIDHYSEALAIATDRSTRSTAHHNRGCAFYERAEAHRKELTETTSKEDDGFQVTFGGPSVEGRPQDPLLTDRLKRDYASGRDDLLEVVAFHEETFQTIKGSRHGLSLSISLFETNSRSFHRLQDCLFNLGEWPCALEISEQSRSRTLGELLLQRKGGQLEQTKLTSPLKIAQVERILESVQTAVVFLSYTGARLLAWVFVPCDGKIITNRFQVLLEDDQFDGKSLDYFLRYSLSEKLIDNTVEMYSYCSYRECPPLSKLFELFGKPLLAILNGLSGGESSRSLRDVIVIPDSYTNLIPLVALLNTASGQFLGDRLCFRIMPSLLTLGIVSQLPQVTVRVPQESPDFCVVGNPSIPAFKYQGETWTLGKLPYATQEAKAVARILKCSPTLHEQATKMVVLSMISKAKIIHLATHGSASAGFLAFAGLGSSRSGSVSDEKLVLLYPEDVAKLAISPALVVLSSCDSGRGMVKADGIQGMARAFIVAGAQAVLTTLWRVPDESAAIFMQFMYQYMMDGYRGSRALRKAMLSIRSFCKYSRYIHWSGYQLTGREVQFQVSSSSSAELMRRRVGPTTVFPRMEPLQTLEKTFVKSPYLPTDAQIVFGITGLKPMEVVTEFVTSNHQHFTGGIFYVDAKDHHAMSGAEERIKQELVEDENSSDHHVLLIFDGLQSLPPKSSLLYSLLTRNSTHIILVLNSDSHLSTLKKQIDTQLMRGTNVIKLDPLSELHSTQRLVHSIMCKSDLVPYADQQNIIADIAKRTIGSPELVELASALLSEYADECGEGEEDNGQFLKKFYNRVCCDGESAADKDNSSIDIFATRLLREFDLSQSELFLLSTLSLFGSAPVPRQLIEIIQVQAVAVSSGLPKLSPLAHLTATHLLNISPSVVILPPQSSHTSLSCEEDMTSSLSASLTEADFYFVPAIVADTVRNGMEDKDWMFCAMAAHGALNRLHSEHTKEGGGTCKIGLAPFLAGLAKTLTDLLERRDNMETCYKEAYRTYVLLATTN